MYYRWIFDAEHYIINVALYCFLYHLDKNCKRVNSIEIQNRFPFRTDLRFPMILSINDDLSDGLWLIKIQCEVQLRNSYLRIFSLKLKMTLNKHREIYSIWETFCPKTQNEPCFLIGPPTVWAQYNLKRWMKKLNFNIFVFSLVHYRLVDF